MTTVSRCLTSSPQRPERLVMAVGATIGLSILGDSFLYSVLPLEAEHLGISLPLVGIVEALSCRCAPTITVRNGGWLRL